MRKCPQQLAEAVFFISVFHQPQWPGLSSSHGRLSRLFLRKVHRLQGRRDGLLPQSFGGLLPQRLAGFYLSALAGFYLSALAGFYLSALADFSSSSGQPLLLTRPASICPSGPARPHPRRPGAAFSPAARLSRLFLRKVHRLQGRRDGHVPVAVRPASTPAAWPFLQRRGRHLPQRPNAAFSSGPTRPFPAALRSLFSSGPTRPFLRASQ